MISKKDKVLFISWDIGSGTDTTESQIITI